MGANAHVLPGDVVATIDHGTVLKRHHPDECPPDLSFSIAKRPWINPEEDKFCQAVLAQGKCCLILGRVAAGSAGKGHAFLVLVDGQVGWLSNHEVIPSVTLREPG